MTVAPRPSATICVVYQAPAGIEVLMVRRSAKTRFMPGAWVFPGGIVDAEDHDPAVAAIITNVEHPVLLPWLAAAFRELVEETGIWLIDPPAISGADRSNVFRSAMDNGSVFPADRTAYFANWITPSMLPVRFDARFFLAAVDGAMESYPDGDEVDAAEFVNVEEALRRSAAGEWQVPFPTQRTLAQIAAFDSVDAAIDGWRSRPVISVQPRIRLDADGPFEVVMPGDPGFDDLTDGPVDPDALRAANRIAGDGVGRPAEVLVDED